MKKIKRWFRDWMWFWGWVPFDEFDDLLQGKIALQREIERRDLEAESPSDIAANAELQAHIDDKAEP